jgi:hypothetical protein
MYKIFIVTSLWLATSIPLVAQEEPPCGGSHCRVGTHCSSTGDSCVEMDTENAEIILLVQKDLNARSLGNRM